MKTILVVYTNRKVTKKEAMKMKHYSFITKADLQVGDMLESDEYDSPMMVLQVFDELYTHFNMASGDLHKELIPNTNVRPIRELFIGERDADVVYARKRQ